MMMMMMLLFIIVTTNGLRYNHNSMSPTLRCKYSSTISSTTQLTILRSASGDTYSNDAGNSDIDVIQRKNNNVNNNNNENNDSNNINDYEIWQKIDSSLEVLSVLLTRNPIARIFINSYNFFYWLPRRNMPYDSPWELFKNSTSQFIAWYQIPHNLPPYNYLGDYPDDFFCWGLPGNTLPLGDWDPWGFQLTSEKVVKKYRESEIKHGRVAMLASVGFFTQELYHPLHPDVGGLAITHLQQLRDNVSPEDGIFGPILVPVNEMVMSINKDINILDSIDRIPVDYFLVISILAYFEIFALKRNYHRWLPNEYNHQFDTNIGIANLKPGYENGNYCFDPLKLMPINPKNKKRMIEIELNHCRLAMVAIIGMIGQEYLTGLPTLTTLSSWLDSDGSISSSTSSSITSLQSAYQYVMDQLSGKTFN